MQFFAGSDTALGIEQALQKVYRQVKHLISTGTVPPTRVIDSGNGLIGGGDLSADRTLDVVGNADGSIQVNASDVQVGILATDTQHGNRGGGPLHIDATSILAGFMSAADKSKLDILGSIERVLVVGLSGQIDDTSVASAIDTAILGGASASSPWLISVKPGTYIEPPMNIPPGIALISEVNRVDTVFIEASNPNEDLFTCTGGFICGIVTQGVTDPTKALFRIATPNAIVVMHGLGWRNCKNGIIVENGAACTITNSGVSISGANQGVETAIICRDAGSFLGVSGFFINVPSAVLPLYPGVNPIQTCISVSGAATSNIDTVIWKVAYNVANNDGLIADNGAFVTLFGASLEDFYYATRIGSTGSNTNIIVQGGAFRNNDVNFRSDSSTGVFQISVGVDDVKFSSVAGGKLNGFAQSTTSGETLVVGDSEYIYSSEKKLNLGFYFHDDGATGQTEGGVVTDAGGLSVDVTAGNGYSSREAPIEDIESVNWSSVSGLSLTDNSTNYIYYDNVSEAIVAGVAPYGSEQIGLALVVTLSGSIIYIHDVRKDIHQAETLLWDYLLDTRKIAWQSGLAVSQGTTNTELDVDAGSWYRAWKLLSVAGGSDITWAYYYGSGGGLTRVHPVTDVDVLQYDNAGVLTTIPLNEYKADTLIVTSDNQFTIIYGTSTFATQAGAEDTANKAAIPSIISPTGCYAALIISQRTGAGVGSVVSYIDIRPDPNAATSGGGGGGGTNDHSALLNLANDDHLQYLRTDGARAMTGGLDVGGNNIGNVGLVDGVDVSGHASRHSPGGLDALALANPVSISVGASPSGGSANSYSRSDHQHGIAAGNPIDVGASNQPGSASSVARSDHQHSHGNLLGGLLHAVATTISNGFMSAADKTKLDGLSGTAGYAEIYLNSPTTQLGITATPATLTLFDTDGINSNATPDQANNRITIVEDGDYDIDFSISFSGGNNITYTLVIAVNGVAQNNGKLQRKLGTGGDVGSGSFSCLLSLTAGQHLTVLISSTTNTIANGATVNLNISKL